MYISNTDYLKTYSTEYIETVNKEVSNRQPNKLFY